MKIASVNQDRGIAPDRHKGAAVHVAAMRAAFEELDAEVVAIDAPDASEVERKLGEACKGGLDLIYERYALDADACAAFGARHGIPHVLEVNSPLALEQQRYRGGTLEAAGPERSFTNAALVVAVSESVADYARERGAPDARILVRPNAVDVKRFRPMTRARRALRDELGLGRRFVLGFHGRLRPWHGFDQVVPLVATLLENGRDVHLMTVGDGPFDEATRGRLPGERCTHLPWVEQSAIAQHVACFDALPLTYAADPAFYFSPLKLREAMACGVVPLVPNLGDLPTLVEDDLSGIVLPAGDPEALARNVTRLIDDRQLRARLSQGAVAQVQGATWTAIARDVLDATLKAAPPRNRA